jgi:hypothetical protein
VPLAHGAGDVWQFESRSPHPGKDPAQPARELPVLPKIPVVHFPRFRKAKSGSISEANRKHFGSASEARKSPEAAFLSTKTAKSNRPRFRSRKKILRRKRAICGLVQRTPTVS